MIEARFSNTNDSEDWFNNIKNIATNLNALKNKSSDVYLNALDLISGVNRDLQSAANKNYKDYQEIEQSIDNKIDNFKLFSNEYIDNVTKHFSDTIERNIRIITGKCKTLEEKKVNKIRGLLTEAVACSYLGDVSQPNTKKFIWDCSFYKNNALLFIKNEKGNEIFTTDIYYNDNIVNLCECKTTPYFKTYQIEFMEYIKDKYEKEEIAVQLYVFVLNFRRNPIVEMEINKLTDNFTLKTLDDIKAAF